MYACRRDCGSTPSRASIRMIATSAVDAPVAMLRVYCTCPGVSAMMNLRLLGREVAVGDVDRDALLALGLEAVGEEREVDLALGAAPRVAPLIDARFTASSWSS